MLTCLSLRKMDVLGIWEGDMLPTGQSWLVYVIVNVCCARYLGLLPNVTDRKDPSDRKQVESVGTSSRMSPRPVEPVNQCNIYSV